MDREERRFLEGFRRDEATSIENNLIDELVEGELDRAEFLRRGAMFGLSAGVMSGALALVGEATAAPGWAASLTVKRGGIVRVGENTWGGSLEPYKLAEAGSLGLATIPGEHLTFSDPSLVVRPWLATSWKANAKATVWTFELRKGVRFHNGQEMTADDVVANYKLYTGDKQSGALSVFGSVLDPAGVIKKGRYTVEFRLKAPNGAFPYLVSQSTYWAIIVPRSIGKDRWVASGMIGTGPFKLKRAVAKRSYDLVRHDKYWGGSPPLDGVKVTIYETSTAMALALRAGQIDIVSAISELEARPLRNDKKFKFLKLGTSAHRLVTMKTDTGVLSDPRVRRAVALTINRPEVIAGILGGSAILGNDTPFWRTYPSAPPSVKQRVQNVTLARQLLQAAGASDLRFKITTHRLQEIPDYAAALQRYGRDAGITIDIELLSDAEYYGGDNSTTPWLNRPATITEWGHRGVPQIYLTSSYASDSTFNASRYKNATVDSAIKSLVSAVDLKTQRRYTKQIAQILLQDTPVIVAYHFVDATPVSARVKNYQREGLNQIRLAKTFLA